MSTTKDLVIGILQAISQKPLTVVEIAKKTYTTESFASWIINGSRYGDLFTKTIPNGFNPALIAPSPKGQQFLADDAENKNNLL